MVVEKDLVVEEVDGWVVDEERSVVGVVEEALVVVSVVEECENECSSAQTVELELEKEAGVEERKAGDEETHLCLGAEVADQPGCCGSEA